MDSPWYQLHKSTWDPIKIYISITTHLPLQLKVILILSVVHIRVMYNKLPINTIKLAMLSKIDKITRIFLFVDSYFPMKSTKISLKISSPVFLFVTGKIEFTVEKLCLQ